MASKSRTGILFPDKLQLRLIQQVPAGTPGAFKDSIFGFYWITTQSKGLNGTGGFVQVEHDPILNDTSAMTVELPPQGSDGGNLYDRLYYFTDTPDPQASDPGGTIGYMPGDEWLELRRNTADLLMSGTPVSETTAPDNVSLVCNDLTQVLLKQRETNAGFWQHAPRDVFEHYTRAWQTIIADDFVNSAAFPTWSDTATTSADGRWVYNGVNGANGSLLTLQRATVTEWSQSTHTWATDPFEWALADSNEPTIYLNPTWAGDTANPLVDAGPLDHSCWRVECSIPTASISAAVATITLGVAPVTALGNTDAVTAGPTIAASPAATTMPIVGSASLTISPVAGAISAQTVGRDVISAVSQEAGHFNYSQDSWPTTVAGLIDSGNHLEPPYTLAIEARERWIYFYFNGQLIGTGLRPWPDPRAAYAAAEGVAPAAAPIVPFVTCGIGGIGGADSITLDYIVVRRTTPPMNGGTPGDYVLPSTPSPGGLQGAYYDMSLATTSAEYTSGNENWYTPFGAAPPNMTPGTVRVDTGVYNTVVAGQTPAWFPSAAGNALMAYVRWTGSIYLPLGSGSVTFQLPSTNLMQCLWVGRTRKGEAICTSAVAGQLSGVSAVSSGVYNMTLDNAFQGDLLSFSSAGYAAKQTSVDLRTKLGTVSGWYPIVFEFIWFQTDLAAGSATCGFEYSLNGGAYEPPTPYALSPYGCFSDQVTPGDSHFDTIQATIGQSFAFNWSSQPKALESGYFPGAIVPKVRVGRDTDLVLDGSNMDNPQETSTAADNATTDLAQAQGLGGNSTGTLTAEAFNFAAMGGHPFNLTESENLPATSELALLTLQLETLLGLRSESWQQLSSDTLGQRSMQDSFPLTNTLMEFDWTPGDGLRVNIPQIYVDDTEPRQIQNLKRMFYPNGVGQTTVGFLPRPRNFSYTMRRFIKQFYSARRSFQGALVSTVGNSVTEPNASSVPLPVDITLVRQATLTVTSKSDTSTPFGVIINGVATGQTVVTTGVVDVSNFVGQNNGVQPQMIAQLTNVTGALDINLTYVLSLLVLINSA